MRLRQRYDALTLNHRRLQLAFDRLVTDLDGEKAKNERLRAVAVAARALPLSGCMQNGAWCDEHDAERWPCPTEALRHALAALDDRPHTRLSTQGEKP